MTADLLQGNMRHHPRSRIPGFLLTLPLTMTLLAGCGRPQGNAAGTDLKPSLVVTTSAPVTRPLERSLAVSGSVGAWQEISLGMELTGIRVADVLVEVGDTVRIGQPLLRLDARTLQVQARQADASVAQGKASLELARANAKRGESLVGQGLISSSDSDELRANLTKGEAQLATAEADRDAARLRLGFATLTAPDAGVISARTVQPGQIVSAGTELLRLIRRGRLEWRAELAENELTRVVAGTVVELTGPRGTTVSGRVRIVSPALDPDTRTGLVYADLPQPGDLRAGMFAEGRILIGATPASVLPRESVVIRDGYPYVFVVKPAAGTSESDGSALRNVEQRRISIGIQQGEFTEILSGVQAVDRVVVRGAAFLSNGDLVREVPAGSAIVAAAPSKKTP